MPSLKDVKIKIGAVKKTQQITKAMNMVATSRLRGAQTAMDQFRPYAAKFSEVLEVWRKKPVKRPVPCWFPGITPAVSTSYCVHPIEDFAVDLM